MANELVAGISYRGPTGQLAVLQIKDGSIKVRHVESFEKEMSDEAWFVEPLMKRKKRVVRKVKKVSIALDNSSVFIYSFPMDTSLSQQEQNEHVRWELSNFISDFDPKTYVQDVHVLQTHARDQVSDVLIVSVKRTVISEIQNRLRNSKHELHKVDTSHFGGQYALLTNYPEVKSKLVALIEVEKKRLDAGIVANGRLVKYASTPIRDGETESCIDELLTGGRVGEIFLFGSDVRGGLTNLLTEKFSVPVTLLNPFRRLRIARGFRKCFEEEIAGREHHFAACIGCALLK